MLCVVVAGTPAAGVAQGWMSEDAPYRVGGARDVTLSAAALLLGGAALFVDDGLPALRSDEIAGLTPSVIPGIDRGAVDFWSPSAAGLSDIGLAAAMALPLMLLADGRIREDALGIGLMYAQTMLLTGSATLLVKSVTRRTRPFVYNPEAPLADKLGVDARRSFFSGHTSMSFASAVFLGMVASDYIQDPGLRTLAWGGPLLLATSVGVLRIAAGKHFPSDVLVGALVGSVFGAAVPLLHRESGGEVALIAAPAAHQGVLGVTIRF